MNAYGMCAPDYSAASGRSAKSRNGLGFDCQDITNFLGVTVDSNLCNAIMTCSGATAAGRNGLSTINRSVKSRNGLNFDCQDITNFLGVTVDGNMCTSFMTCIGNNAAGNYAAGSL